MFLYKARLLKEQLRQIRVDFLEKSTACFYFIFWGQVLQVSHFNSFCQVLPFHLYTLEIRDDL